MRKFHHHSKVVIFTATIKLGSYGKTVLDFRELSELTYFLSLEEAIERGLVRKVERDYINDNSELPNLRDLLFNEDDHNNFRKYGQLLEIIKQYLDEKRKAFSQAPHMAIALAADPISADQLLEIWKVKYPDLADGVESYHSFQTIQERRRVMSRIKANELSLVVLTGSNPLEIDHPQVSIAAVTFDTKSLALYTWFARQALKVYRQEGYTEDKSFVANIVEHCSFGPRENGYKVENNDLFPM